VAHIENF